MIQETKSPQDSQKQDRRNIYIYMCLCVCVCVCFYVCVYAQVQSCGHHVSSCIVYHVPKCMGYHKAIFMMTGRANCFHDYIYITVISLL